MATEWMPLTRFEPRSWLLANGKIIKEPPLEQTSTGKKVRVVGTKTSFFANNLDTLLLESANAAAQELGTSVMVEVRAPSSREDEEQRSIGFNPSQHTPARLHLVHDPASPGSSTNLWWRFKHPSAPYEVVLYATAMYYPTSVMPSRQHIKIGLSMPVMNQRYGFTEQINITSYSYTEFINTLTDAQAFPWREFFRDNRPEWDDKALANGVNVPSHHKTIETLLSLVRDIERLDTIQVPNLADLDNPSWMELELYETNVNAEFISDMTEWLDSNPLVEGVLNAYQNLLQQLASSGFTVNEKSGNDFLSALLSGNTASMNMQVANALSHDGSVDRWHTVSIHLPTGTLVVECAHSALDQGAVAEQWQEALTIAQLSGEEDVLVEYARAVAAKEASIKAKKIIKDRQ